MLVNLVYMFSVSGYSVECISIKIRLFGLRLNYNSVKGNSVIGGSGFSMDVSVDNKLCLICVDIVSVVSMKVSMIFVV